MIIWLTGISGVGKSTIAKALYSKLKRRFIMIDGDVIRKINNNDLGYSKIDRDTNAKRLINLAEYLSKQNINLIISANITSIKFRKVIKKKLRNFYEIHISAEMKNLLKRDYKNIYKNALSKKIKEVVGVDIKYHKPKNCFLYLENNSNKKSFLKNVNLIIKKIFKK